MKNFRESDLLRELVRTQRTSSHVIEGVNEQDDAAVVAIPEGRDVCATTDFVRGTEFALHQLGYLSMHDLGRYLVAANVSDLAAMGAKPLSFLAVVRYTKNRKHEEISEILAGIDDACRDFGCPLIGGDSGSYITDVLSGTALGTVPSGHYLSRRTAQPGDVVFVSGQIGAAAAALAAATGNSEPSKSEAFIEALQRWRQPTPRIDLGQALAAVPERISCMDVSDGLTASLQQLSRIASVGFEIQLNRLPIPSVVNQLANELRLDPVQLACSASVDFELLVTCEPRVSRLVVEAAERAGVSITEIGRCVAGGTIAAWDSDDHNLGPMPGVPWDHQSEEVRTLFHEKD